MHHLDLKSMLSFLFTNQLLVSLKHTGLVHNQGTEPIPEMTIVKGNSSCCKYNHVFTVSNKYLSCQYPKSSIEKHPSHLIELKCKETLFYFKFTVAMMDNYLWNSVA